MKPRMIMEKQAVMQGEEKERCVLVGFQMDANGQELLDWTISKVAEQGDRVVVVHVCRDSDLKSTTTLSLITALDEHLAACEGFCNLKQIALVGRVSRGNSIRKVLVREAKLCSAVKVVVGVNKHCSPGGSASVAKYCAKKLPPTTAVIAIQYGRDVFGRLPGRPSLGKLLAQSEGEEEEIVISQSTSEPTTSPTADPNEEEIQAPGNVTGDTTNTCATSFTGQPHKSTQEPRLGWPLLGRRLTNYVEESRDDLNRKVSVVQWVMSLPNRSLSFSSRLQLELAEELKTILRNNNSNCRWFPYDQLCAATDGFDPGNVIGKGGSSKVYRGCLPEGLKIAIKLSALSEEASRNFLSEVDIITKLDHKLIVPLIGLCIEDSTLISVYNYFPRGSLEENLHGKRNITSPLPWDLRFKVAIGVAEALTYLHSGCSSPVIHRDVKSSNILLTDDLEPQLSDFGLAIRAPTTSTNLTNTDVVGTFGYLAPEYFMYGKVSSKIDVFAFGVVLLELLTGRKSICDDNPKGQESLVMWATPILERGDLMHLLDPSLIDKHDEQQMRRIGLAASLCISRRASLRPEMREILSLLQGEVEMAAWMSCHIADDDAMKRQEGEDDEVHPSASIRSHISLALLDVEDDASLSSFDQSNHATLEDHLKDRWSRSSSFD